MNENEKDNDVKKFLGLPMRWNFNKMFKDIWDPEENRIFPPKHFGVGWGLNFHALFRKISLIEMSEKDQK